MGEKKAPSLRPRFLWIFLMLWGTLSCTQGVRVDRSMPLRISLEPLQPIAILPIPIPSGYPGEAEELEIRIKESLSSKGYRILDPASVSKILGELELSSEKLVSDPSALLKFQKESGAKVLFMADFLEYRIRRPQFREMTYQVWDGVTYEYQSLPTFYRGSFFARLKLKLITAESGHVIWLVEGTSEGSSFSVKPLTHQLLFELLAQLPEAQRSESPE